MSTESRTERDLAIGGISAAAILVIALVVALFSLHATGRDDPQAKKPPPCAPEITKKVTLSNGDMSIETPSALFHTIPEHRECAETEIHMRAKAFQATEVSALAYNIRNVNKDGNQCTWTDAGGTSHLASCATTVLGSDSEVYQTLVTEAREQLRYPGSWNGELFDSWGDRPKLLVIDGLDCTQCATTSKEYKQ